MKTSIRIGVVLLAAFVGVSTLSARGDSYVGKAKQWTIVNFANPVEVKGTFIQGTVMVLHDSEKMARGEACTTFYRFDKARGPQEAIVSFHCNPRMTDAANATQFITTDGADGCPKLVEYQIAGDAEAHGVPVR